MLCIDTASQHIAVSVRAVEHRAPEIRTEGHSPALWKDLLCPPGNDQHFPACLQILHGVSAGTAVNRSIPGIPRNFYALRIYPHRISIHADSIRCALLIRHLSQLQPQRQARSAGDPAQIRPDPSRCHHPALRRRNAVSHSLRNALSVLILKAPRHRRLQIRSTVIRDHKAGCKALIILPHKSGHPRKHGKLRAGLPELFRSNMPFGFHKSVDHPDKRRSLSREILKSQKLEPACSRSPQITLCHIAVQHRREFSGGTIKRFIQSAHPRSLQDPAEMFQVSRLQQRMLRIIFLNIFFIIRIDLKLTDLVRQERDRRLLHIVAVIPVCRGIDPVQEILPVCRH